MMHKPQTGEIIKNVMALVILLTMSCQPVAQTIDYFGQQEPGEIPEVFAPGLISLDDRYEFGSVFSKDGSEFFLGVEQPDGAEILYTQKVNDAWTDPVTIIGDNTYGYNDPFLSPDEQQLYYISTRTSGENDSSRDYDIWYSNREEDGWSDPINAGPMINSNRDEYYISFTKSGAMYFASNKADEKNFEIYKSEKVNGSYSEPVRLSEQVNTRSYEADVFVDPDEQYVIFCSRRTDGLGRGDLYVSFKNEKGQWTMAQSLGDKVNTKGHELCPYVSPDGRFLFYTSNQDIYWVSMELVHKLKPS